MPYLISLMDICNNLIKTRETPTEIAPSRQL